MEFVLPAVAWRFQRFMQKHRKWTARLPLSARCFLIAQAGFFYMLYYNSRDFLRYNNSSKIPCTKPWFFPSKFCKISLFMKVLTMPYLPTKDELVSLNRLSSRWLWKWYNSKVFDRRLYGVGQHFTFCPFSRKRESFGDFDCDLRKWKGFFWLNMKNFEISVLTANSRYLQTAALNHEFITSRDLSVKVWSYSGQISMALFSCSLCR